MKFYIISKRIFDIVVSACALLLLSPVLIIAAICIKLESKGPILYGSFRVGQGYKIFKMYKLRTMFTDADQQMQLMKSLNAYNDYKPKENEEMAEDCPLCKKLGHACSPILYADDKSICENLMTLQKMQAQGASFIKIQNDPRVTKVGRFLRKTSIDELPQLLNVLIGDMSVIGNRPLPMYEAELLTADHSIGRFNAPAGLTGLWQVVQRSKRNMSEQERIQLDLDYANQCGFVMDAKILLKTIPALLQEGEV